MICKGLKLLVLAVAVLVLAAPAARLYAQDQEDDNPFIVSGAPATAKKKDTSEAEQFYQKCLAKPIVSTTKESDTAFCACAATQLQKWNEAPTKQSGNEFYSPLVSKDLDTNTWITEIYGPCLHIPVYDLTNDECLTAKKNTFFIGEPDLLYATCDCIAKGEADYYEKYAADYLRLRVSQKAVIVDPITEVTKDMDYYDVHVDIENQCYNQFANIKR